MEEDSARLHGIWNELQLKRFRNWLEKLKLGFSVKILAVQAAIFEITNLN